MIWHKLLRRTLSTIYGNLNCSPNTTRAVPLLELTELEDRILMSATPIAPDVMADTNVDDTGDVHEVATEGIADSLRHAWAAPDNSSDLLLPDAAASDHAQEALADAPSDHSSLAFVDTSIDGYQDLVAHLQDEQGEAGPLEVVLLQSDMDGIEQITHALEQHDQLSAVHILAHGTDSAIKLGNTWLDADRINAYAGTISGWSDALSSDADILFYSCGLASSPEGQSVLEAFHVLTGADVAASVDTTGHVSLGGDWSLEFTLGSVETPELMTSEARLHWYHVLSSECVRDDFANISFSGNDGTAHWTHDWQESGESDGASSGALQVVGKDLGAGGTHSLHFEALNGIAASRELDLSTATSATLSYSWQRHDVDGFFGATLEAQVSSDGGGNWSTLHAISDGSDAMDITSSFDLTSFASANTQIRFIVNGTGSGSVYLDEVQIDYETLIVLPPPPVNHAPFLNSGNALNLFSIDEDNVDSAGTAVASILFSAGDDRISDVDPSALEGIAVISVDNSHGQWQYDASATGSWQTIGTVNDQSAVLLGTNSLVRFVPNADYSGLPGQIQFHAWDQTSGNVGDTGVDVSTNGGETAYSTATDTAGITVLSVNDAPQLSVPASLSIPEKGALSILDVSINDVDVDTADMQISLAVDHGKLTLGTTTGLSFTTGNGILDPTLIFTGNVTDINAALGTLEYRADVHYNGLDALNVSVDDLGNSGSGGPQVDSRSVEISVLSVNDAPELSLPASLSVNEDTNLAILGLAVSDVDAGIADMQITLAVDHGQLTLGTTAGLTFTTGDGTQDPTLDIHRVCDRRQCRPGHTPVPGRT